MTLKRESILWALCGAVFSAALFAVRRRWRGRARAGSVLRLPVEAPETIGDDDARQLAQDPDMDGGAEVKGISSEPPLTLTVSAGGSASCQSREPHSPQNRQRRRRPLSAGRDQDLTAPCVRRKPLLGTIREMPKAEADCFWHSRQ